MNQSEFIREAISSETIKPTIVATLVSDDLLAAVGKLTAEYGRIGNNLNQIARHLNEWHSPYPATEIFVPTIDSGIQQHRYRRGHLLRLGTQDMVASFRQGDDSSCTKFVQRYRSTRQHAGDCTEHKAG